MTVDLLLILDLERIHSILLERAQHWISRSSQALNRAATYSPQSQPSSPLELTKQIAFAQHYSVSSPTPNEPPRQSFFWAPLSASSRQILCNSNLSFRLSFHHTIRIMLQHLPLCLYFVGRLLRFLLQVSAAICWARFWRWNVHTSFPPRLSTEAFMVFVGLLIDFGDAIFKQLESLSD